MPEIVIDTSVLARGFYENPLKPKVDLLLEYAAFKRIKILSPLLLKYETLSVLVKHCLNESEVKYKFSVFEMMIGNSLINIKVENNEIFEKAIEISNLKTQDGSHISIYDSIFHSVAMLNNCLFLTADLKHVNNTKNIIGHVVSFNEYNLNEL